jgi:hypothetical protein
VLLIIATLLLDTADLELVPEQHYIRIWLLVHIAISVTKAIWDIRDGIKLAYMQRKSWQQQQRSEQSVR